MSNSLVAITIDCADAPALAGFWADVLGRQIAEDSTSEHAVLLPGGGDRGGPRITFNTVPEPKTRSDVRSTASCLRYPRPPTRPLPLLLAVFEDQSASAADLCRALEMNRTVAHRLLVTLRNRGFVSRAGDEYMLGPPAAQLASGSAPTLWEAAGPAMDQFAAETGETVVLQVVNGGTSVILAQVIGRQYVVRVE